MNIFGVFLGLLICLVSLGDLSADQIRLRRRTDPILPDVEKTKSITSRGKKHGREYRMLGRGAKKSIFLGNNRFYEPCHDHDAELANDWVVDDIIRVLKTSDESRFILVNRRTGESLKAKILNWS
ncbi:MAG: hypothetical protein LLF94_01875 [Chlamydiales bacterium]|nr:hypothetical protein [Chlamydiales bacterium]